MKKILVILMAAATLSSCVSAKIHKELQAKYNDLEEENVALRQERDELKAELGAAKDEIRALENTLQRMQEDTLALFKRYTTLDDKYRELNRNYEFLLESNNALLSSNQAENRKLMEKLNRLQTELQAKEDSLTGEQQKMEHLSQELQKREARVYELESLIAQQEDKVNEVRNRLKEALFNFDGKGLSVEQREGKVYVSLENSLLFPSGSWQVQERGREALAELAKVLAQNPDLHVMVEGHTDSDAFRGSTAVKDNWDLSVMRATSIVKELEKNEGVEPKMITAAGRSEFLPIASNDTPEGKAKNRRTEIIITPDLGELMKLLSEANQ